MMSDTATPAAPAATDQQNTPTPAAPAPTSQQPAPAAPVDNAPAAPAADPKPVQSEPASEPVKEAIGAEPEVDNRVTYSATGDAGLDVALDFIGNLGLGPEHDAVKDAVDGKFERLEATLEAMGDKAKGFEKFVDLAKDAYKRSDEASKKVQAEVTAVCIEAAGGQEQWDTIKKWAGENADEGEKEAINAMLDAGPVQARAAATMLLNAYNQASGTTVKPKEAVSSNAGPNNNTGNGALSGREYADAVRELRSRLGSSMEGSQEYAALQARRRAYRG